MIPPLRRLTVVAVWCLVVCPVTARATPITVHESFEFFFESGGTHVTDCLGSGCSDVSFVIGPISGEVLWSVQEKVLRDPQADTTTFAYTLFNEALTSPITSFTVSNSGFQGIDVSPSGWTFAGSGSAWRWSATDAMLGIQAGLFLPGFEVTLPGAVPVGFGPAMLTLASGETVSSPTWMATTPVPEPASLLLVGSGLIGLSARRYSRGRRRPS